MLITSIVSINLKSFFSHKGYFFLFFIFLIVLCFGAAILGNFFARGDNLLDTTYVAIVDLDDSEQSRLILSSITETNEFGNIIEFLYLTENQAQKEMEHGNVTALVTLPIGFGESITTGENIPFSIVYNENNLLSSTLIMIVAEAFAGMLRSSQIGVYTTLNFAQYVGVTPQIYNQVFWGINLRFIGMVLNRHNIFDTQLVTTNQISAGVAYFIAAYITLLLCSFFVISDIVSKNFKRFVIHSIKLRGFNLNNILFGCVISYFCLLLIINILLLLVIYATGFLAFNMSLLFGILYITFVISIFGTAVTFIFRNNFDRGVFVTVFSSFSLFLSGGVIPLEFMGDWANILSFFVFNYWATQLLAGTLIGESVLIYSSVILVFAAIFWVAGYIFLSNVSTVASE